MKRIRENICKVLVGREETIELVLTALLAGGHVLLEDMPGTGKTKLAKTLAKSLGIDFTRIQFTPDLLPTDLTGLHIYDPKENQFVLHKGPVFTNILLADEINRATPRTQSGLLECMEEHQVTIDGTQRKLEQPFFVIATQNPIETAGTFPLPEAQLDRFMMKLALGQSSMEEEICILERFLKADPEEEIEAVVSKEALLQMQKEASEVYVAPAIMQYVAELVTKSRKDERIRMGISTRGSIAMLRAVRCYAYLQGRDYCIPDDVKKLAVAVFAHRIVLSYGGVKQSAAESIIMQIVSQTDVPTEEWRK